MLLMKWGDLGDILGALSIFLVGYMLLILAHGFGY